MVPATSALFLNTLMMVANETVIQSSPREMPSYNNYLLQLGIEPTEEKCYGSFGCFDLRSPWTSDQRPVSLYPESLEKVHPNFALYNAKNRHNPVYLDINDIYVAEEANMDVKLMLYLIIHGFTDDGSKQWMIRMKDEILKKENCNVILVDWGRASSPPYPQAVANIRLAGAITAHLLESIYASPDVSDELSSDKVDKVHCIGHSLGAHMCGYIGYQLQNDFGLMMGRITGMDPAEPHFAKTKPPIRLDKSAAKYVDVIHTDAGGFTTLAFGIVENIGHVDFFPNGGYNQPGCTETFGEMASKNGFVMGVKKYVGCSHIRSYELFTDSINLKCPFLSISCSSYNDFQEGKCFKCGQNGHNCITFGMHSNTSYFQQISKRRLVHHKHHVQYLLTSDREPFCKSHYKITVQVSSHEESKAHGGEIGTLWFRLHTTSDGTGQMSDKIALGKETYHEPGARYTYILPGDGVPRIKAVEVEWQYTTNIINPLTWRITSTPRIYIDKVIVEALEINQSIVVCSKEKKALLNSVSQILLTSFCRE